jgi:hypothetical protein
VTQGDVVALLSVGSAASEKVELVGEAGAKQLVAVKEEGNKGLAAYFAAKGGAAGVLRADGLPPVPQPMNSNKSGEKRYEMLEEQSYSSE